MFAISYRLCPCIVWLLVLQHIPQNCLGVQGDHICHTEEVYTELEKTLTTQPVKIRSYNWCLEIPPRCSIYRTEIKEVIKVQNVTKSRLKEHCCDGYAEIVDDNETICKPICRGGCGKGYCEQPNQCVCDTGYTGRHCTHRCRHGMWGDECKSRCTCKNGALCDNKTGFCRCVEGWIGVSCELPCPTGYYGIMCKSVCECSSNKCHPQTGECLMEDSLILFDWTSPNASSNVMRLSKERIEAKHWIKVENGSMESTAARPDYRFIQSEMQKLLQSTVTSMDAWNVTSPRGEDDHDDGESSKEANESQKQIKPSGMERQLVININIDNSSAEKNSTDQPNKNATELSATPMMTSSNTTILTNPQNEIVAVLQETANIPMTMSGNQEDSETNVQAIIDNATNPLNATIVTNHMNNIVAVLQESSMNAPDNSTEAAFVDQGFTTNLIANDGMSITSNATILTNTNNEIVAVLQENHDRPIFVNLSDDKERASKETNETIAAVTITCLFLALTILAVLVIIMKRKNQNAYPVSSTSRSGAAGPRDSQPHTAVQIINEPLPEIPKPKCVAFETPQFVFDPEFQTKSTAEMPKPDHYDHPPNNLSVQQLPSDQPNAQLPYNYNFNTFPRKNPTRRYSTEHIYDEIQYSKTYDDQRVGELLI